MSGIQAYVGLPGSGKSYNAVAQTIIPALREGRTVVTNIPVNKPAIFELFPLAQIKDFPIDEVAQEPARIFDHVQAGVVWVVDELWKLFPAGQTVKHVPQEFKTLLAEHRHRLDKDGNAISIVFVTQDLAQIGAFARQLVQTTIVHTKLSHLGANKSFKAAIYHGAQTGQTPPQAAKLNQVLGRYDPKIFKLYTSHTMSEANGANVNESSMDTRANIWKRPGLWASAAACTIAIWWAISTLGDIFGSPDVPAMTPTKIAVAPSSSPRVREAPKVSPSHVSSWRVAAVFESQHYAHAYAIVTNDNGDHRYLDIGQCTRHRTQWSCLYEGARVYMRDSFYPEQSKPASLSALTPGDG